MSLHQRPASSTHSIRELRQCVAACLSRPCVDVTAWIRSSPTSTQAVTNTGLLSCQRWPAPLAPSSRLRAGEWDRRRAAGWIDREAGGSGTRERSDAGLLLFTIRVRGESAVQPEEGCTGAETLPSERAGANNSAAGRWDRSVCADKRHRARYRVGRRCLTFTLLERGASSAVAVDASAAYVSAARDEASQRGACRRGSVCPCRFRCGGLRAPLGEHRYARSRCGAAIRRAHSSSRRRLHTRNDVSPSHILERRGMSRPPWAWRMDSAGCCGTRSAPSSTPEP